MSRELILALTAIAFLAIALYLIITRDPQRQARRNARRIDVSDRWERYKWEEYGNDDRESAPRRRG